MRLAEQFLRYLRLFQTWICFAAFAVMAASLMWDVLKREITGSGEFGAPQVGVVGMIWVAFMGIGLASANGSHFRPRFADPLIPERFEGAVNRFAEFAFAAFCLFVATIATKVVVESYELDSVTSVLRWPIWPIQGSIVVGFGLVALRHVLYGIYPELRPAPPNEAEGVEIADHDETEHIVHAGDRYRAEHPDQSGRDGGR